ncbi:MAG: type III-B CRISPR module-associated protein Cmr5 [Phycisphaerae bacterium]
MMQTNSQKMAQAAFTAVAGGAVSGEFKSFARGFPTMAHTSGLAQAIAFAQGKGMGGHHDRYLKILATVLNAGGFVPFPDTGKMAEMARAAGAEEYMRLSRGAFIAADWIKRYAEALAPDDIKKTEGRP